MTRLRRYKCAKLTLQSIDQRFVIENYLSTVMLLIVICLLYVDKNNCTNVMRKRNLEMTDGKDI